MRDTVESFGKIQIDTVTQVIKIKNLEFKR